MENKWVLKNLKTGAYLRDGNSSRDLKFHKRIDCMSFIEEYGDIVFTTSSKLYWIPFYTGEIFTAKDLCKRIEENSDNLDGLAELRDYMEEFIKRYSLDDLEKIMPLLGEKIKDAFIKKKSCSLHETYRKEIRKKLRK